MCVCVSVAPPHTQTHAPAPPRGCRWTPLGRTAPTSAPVAHGHGRAHSEDGCQSEGSSHCQTRPPPRISASPPYLLATPIFMSVGCVVVMCLCAHRHDRKRCILDGGVHADPYRVFGSPARTPLHCHTLPQCHPPTWHPPMHSFCRWVVRGGSHGRGHRRVVCLPPPPPRLKPPAAAAVAAAPQQQQ